MSEEEDIRYLKSLDVCGNCKFYRPNIDHYFTDDDEKVEFKGGEHGGTVFEPYEDECHRYPPMQFLPIVTERLFTGKHIKTIRDMSAGNQARETPNWLWPMVTCWNACGEFKRKEDIADGGTTTPSE